MTLNNRLSALALGVALCSAATAADLAQPVPPAPAAATDGLIHSLNATSLKAVFDAAGVPVEVHTTDQGYTYLSGSPQDYKMFVYPLDCEGSSLDGQCKAIALESALWTPAIGPEKANEYNRNVGLANAVTYEADGGRPVVEYTFAVDAGVGPDYVRTILRYFTYSMQNFGKYLSDLQAAQASAPASGFAVKMTDGPLQSADRRAGARSSAEYDSGDASFGTTTKVIKR